MTRIALVDDHQLFSSVLALALREQGLDVAVPAITTVAEIGDHLAAIRPDVLLLDRDLGTAGNGEDLIAPASSAGIAVVILAAFLDDTTMGRCLAAGALVCIPKTTPFLDVLATVVAVAHGACSCPPSERARLIESWRRSESATTGLHSRFDQLTQREAAILAQLVAGHRVKSIATREHVSNATVRTHVQSIHHKLGVTGQLEAVALAAQVGWQPPNGASRRTGTTAGS